MIYAALLSFVLWLALLVGWLWVFIVFFRAGQKMTGAGMASGGMVLGAVWALVFYGIQAHTFDMLIWVIDEWRTNDEGEGEDG